MKKELFLLLSGLSLGWSAYYCADTGFYYSDQAFCDSVCSNPCEVLLDNPQGLTCDTTNYELFIYNPQTNKTIAITKSSDFWDQFSSLLVIEDVSDNEAGREILSYLNTTAWIGLHDPNLSPSYNSVDPSRFVWYDGTQVSYTNWASGEPNNVVFNEDIGVVVPLGEHWVHMYANGKWNDNGLHAKRGGDYKPRFRALVMWRQQLDCVNGLTQNNQTTTTDMVNLYCNGQTPCYLCTDGTDLQACSLGDAFVGSYELKGSGQLSEVSFTSPLSGKVKMRATGLINYCNGTGDCPRQDGDALLSWIVFKGDDGNYYWFGNPNSSPVCTGNLQLRPLSYTTDAEGNFVVDIPQGVQLVSFIDVESLSGQCTGDNVFNFSLTFLSGNQEWLCPIQNNCQCPGNSSWDSGLKKCVASPDLSCTDASYTLDPNTNVCVSSPLCSGGSYNTATNRCETSPTSVCPSGSSYDSSLDLCFTSATCSGGYTFNPNTDRCEIPATVTCSRGNFNQQTGWCEFSPECPPGSTLVNGRCEKPPQTACGIGTYDPVDNRFEWSPTCPVGTYNPSTDRCEISPSCPAGSLGSSGLCEEAVTWVCSPGYTYNSSTGQCEYTEVIDAVPNCPSGYTYNTQTGMCEASPQWVCVLEKSGCVNPPQRFSCTGGNCSSGGLSFGASCEVDPGCGVLTAGGTCTDSSSPACTYTNSSYRVCPDGSISSVCEVTPSYSCPSGYTLVGTTCQKLYTQSATPSCPSGFTYDSNLGKCTATPECPQGTTYDRANTVCYADTANVGCGSANYDPVQDVCWTGWLYLCDTGYSFDASKKVCYTSPTCPAGNLVNGVCQIAPDTNCGSNAFDSSSLVCYYAPECPALFSYSSSRNRCEKQSGRTCSVGTYDPSSDVCYFDPSCPGSGTYDANADRCEMQPQRSCSSPFVYDSSLESCLTDRVCSGMTACTMSESCPGGGTYDASAGVCWVDATPVCPSGGTYDAAPGKCETGPVWKTVSYDIFNGWYGDGHSCGMTTVSNGYTYYGCTYTGTITLPEDSTVYLKWNVKYQCDDDHGWMSFKSDTGASYYNGTCSLPPNGTAMIVQNFTGGSFSYTAEYYDSPGGWDWIHLYLDVQFPTCPPSYTYLNGKCWAEPSYTCPTGYTYNSRTKRCEAPRNISMTCPLDPSLPCIQHTDGNYYCSPNQCLDATQFPPTSSDTQQGVNDIPADGTVDQNGCNGTIYVFNGKDLRCRPPGTQTGFSDCCKKTKTWFGLGSCNQSEKELASLRSWGKLDGNCHYVGSYCAEWWPCKSCKPKTCVQRKKTFCCFSSPLARIIHEQGRPQLGIGWGSPTSPNCRGFTVQEFQKLDFTRIDFSEWVTEEVKKNITPQIQTNINNVVNNLPSQIQVR